MGITSNGKQSIGQQPVIIQQHQQGHIQMGVTSNGKQSIGQQSVIIQRGGPPQGIYDLFFSF